MRYMLGLVFVGIMATATASAPRAYAAPVVGEQSACVQRVATGAANQATLVVTFGDGSTRTFCIEFSEDSISGMELLERSGLSVVTQASGGLGAAVCSIDGVGCNDPGDCFCEFGGGSNEYWVYYRYDDGAWQYSQQGAGARIVHNGDVDGWVWGSGGDPPDASGEICPELTPEPSPLPSAIPAPSSTPAPDEPTSTRVPAQESPTIAPVAPVATTTPAAPPMPTPAAAGTGAQPTSAVLSEGREPATSATASAQTSTPTTATSRTPSVRTATGAVQVSDEEGQRNLAGQDDRGAWSWRSTAVFGGVAVLLLSIGGAVLWRRRGSV